MSAEKGSAFLLKVGNGAQPPVYATVAGMRTTQMSVNGEAVNMSESNYLYTAEERAADGASGPLTIAVAQVGTFATSRAARKIVTPKS